MSLVVVVCFLLNKGAGRIKNISGLPLHKSENYFQGKSFGGGMKIFFYRISKSDLYWQSQEAEPIPLNNAPLSQ